MIKSYRDLEVWKSSLHLAEKVYEVSRQLPKAEQFGLASQIQRAAVSIPSNIAEGQQRNGSREFKQFLGIARGSAAELSTQLLLVNRIYRVNTSNLVIELENIQRMLFALQSKL